MSYDIKNLNYIIIIIGHELKIKIIENNNNTE